MLGHFRFNIDFCFRFKENLMWIFSLFFWTFSLMLMYTKNSNFSLKYIWESKTHQILVHAIKNSVLYLGKIFADCEFVCLFVYYYILLLCFSLNKRTQQTCLYLWLLASHPISKNCSHEKKILQINPIDNSLLTLIFWRWEL